MKIIVLGAGLVGNVIARDLADNLDYEVSLVDLNQEVLDEITAKYNTNRKTFTNVNTITFYLGTGS